MGAIIAALAGVARAGIGIAEASRQKRRSEQLIQQAYGRGRQRLDLSQLDVRQGVAEESVQRGLTGGGQVAPGGPVQPGQSMGVAGATDLGGQQRLDLAREQTLGQNELVAQRDEALSGVRGSYENAVIGSVAQGITTGTTVAGLGGVGEGGSTGSPLPTGGPAGDVVPAPSGGAVAAAYGAPPGGAAAAGYSNAWGNVHPVQPWGVGGGSPRQGEGTNASFSIYGGA